MLCRSACPSHTGSIVPSTVRIPCHGIRTLFSQRSQLLPLASSSNDEVHGGKDAHEDSIPEEILPPSGSEPMKDPLDVPLEETTSFYQKLSKYSSSELTPGATSSPPEASSSGGDEDVQDALAEVLMLSIRKEQVKGEVRSCSLTSINTPSGVQILIR